jgi:hypothetical protein
MGPFLNKINEKNLYEMVYIRLWNVLWHVTWPQKTVINWFSDNMILMVPCTAMKMKCIYCLRRNVQEQDNINWLSDTQKCLFVLVWSICCTLVDQIRLRIDIQCRSINLTHQSINRNESVYVSAEEWKLTICPFSRFSASHTLIYWLISIITQFFLTYWIFYDVLINQEKNVNSSIKNQYVCLWPHEYTRTALGAFWIEVSEKVYVSTIFITITNLYHFCVSIVYHSVHSLEHEERNVLYHVCFFQRTYKNV